MPSRGEQLLQAIVSALGASGQPSGLAVHRARTRPIEHDDLPATVVYVISEDVTTQPGAVPRQGIAQRTMRVRLEHRVEVPDDTAADAALDDLASWGSAAMMTDRRWTGLAIRTEEVERQWAAIEAERTLAAQSQDFTITYLTQAADQSAAP